MTRALLCAALLLTPAGLWAAKTAAVDIPAAPAEVHGIAPASVDLPAPPALGPTVLPVEARGEAQAEQGVEQAEKAQTALEAAPPPSGEASSAQAEEAFLEAIGARFDKHESGFKLGPGDNEFNRFQNPNEKKPTDALDILRQAPKGAYVAVGTARGFMGAAVTRASHLLLADYSAGIVVHNRITIAMLDLAKDRKEFLRLRDPRTPLSEILALAKERKISPASLRALEGESETQTIRYGDPPPQVSLRSDVAAWQRGEASSELRPGNRAFAGLNYLEDDALFGHLKGLADRRRITAIQLDLGDQMDVKEVVDAMRAQGVMLGTLDVSNAWQEAPVEYMKRAAFAKLVSAFGAVARPDSLVLATLPLPNATVPRGMGFHWNYYGFRFGEVQRRGDGAWKTLYDHPAVLTAHRINPPDGPASPLRRFWNALVYYFRMTVLVMQVILLRL